MPQGAGGNERAVFGISKLEVMAIGAVGALAAVLPAGDSGAARGGPLT